MSQALRSVPSLPVLPGRHTNPRNMKSAKHLDPRSKSQKVAMHLLQREELNAKRSRLEALLTQQFIAKYGSKRGGGQRVNSFIRSTISDFLHHYTDMSQAEKQIDTLEASIRETTSRMRQDIVAAKQSARSEDRRQQQEMHLQLERQRSGEPVDSQGLSVEPSWAVLNALKVAEAQEKEDKKQKDAIEKRARYKVELDAQRDHLRSTRVDHGAVKAKELEANKKIAADHAADIARKAQEKKQKGERERELRQLQIEANNQKRDQERQMKILAEQADMARSRRLAAEEEAAVQRKRELDSLRVEQVKLENERNKALKEEAKRQQWEYEAKLNREYEAKLDREEKARQEAFQKRADALKAFENNFSGVAAAEKAANDAEYERTMAAIEEKHEKDLRKAQQKEKKRKMDMAKSREFNLMLIEKKERQKKEEREADVQRRLASQRALEEERHQDAIKKESKRRQMAEMKAALDEQVRHRAGTVHAHKTAALSATEHELNKGLIAKIEANPELYQKVMAKVKPTPRGGMGDFRYG